MTRFTFRPAEKAEVPAVFDLIMGRVHWMDTVGIRQWNVTDYAGCYPLHHYEAARQRGDLFVMVDEEGVKAASYIEIPGAGAAQPPEDEVDMVLDRPFVFVITSTGGIPLFTGVVIEP